MYFITSEEAPELLLDREYQNLMILHTLSLKAGLERRDAFRRKKGSKRRKDSLKLLRESLGSRSTERKKVSRKPLNNSYQYVPHHNAVYKKLRKCDDISLPVFAIQL